MTALLAASGVAMSAPAGTPAAPATLDAAACPLYLVNATRARQRVEAAIAAGVNVPVPKDGGGGATHEQHKRNYEAIYFGGHLFKETGDIRYAHYIRDVLLAYAELYPTLGPHPARRHEESGRLFWQILNDTVWQVHVIEGYEAVRDTFTDAERKRIEEGVLLPAAEFLSAGSPKTFSLIHNHATWATAAVGMTGYVLGRDDLVKRALLGLDGTGTSGFLRQLDELLSPDGYYTEGPYYQRYAMLPFLVFADAIDRHEPARKIFEHRNGVLVKLLDSAIQQTYDGAFFPVNDALKDKRLDTWELVESVAIGYERTRNPQLLSIAQGQGRVALGEAGRRVACDVAAGLAKPFPFHSMRLSDGANGDHGALVILRDPGSPLAATLVAKNTDQGMGHGHFDRLNWLYYDNGHELVRDYGAARFLNIEAKQGGIYLPENTSWAKQTIAHNTLVQDETSQFGGNAKRAEGNAAEQVHFSDAAGLQVSTARLDGAYAGTRMLRTLAMVSVPGAEHPLVLDLLKVSGSAAHRYDLPLHYNGHLIDVGPTLTSHVDARPVLGAANGYQHLWVDATAKPEAKDAFVTWLLGDRFYTWRWLPQAGAQVVLAETGANDPEFNLRREPVLIQRIDGGKDAVFVGALETHGSYDAKVEQTVASDSRIRAIHYQAQAGIDLVAVDFVDGSGLVLALSYDTDPGHRHAAKFRGRTLDWTGFSAKFDLNKGQDQ